MAEPEPVPAPVSAEGPRFERRMPFMDHLVELRTRLRNAVLCLLVASGITYGFRAQLFELMARPLTIAWQESPVKGQKLQLIFTSPVEAFMVLFKLSLIAALFLGSPFIFWQIWKFISPGLYARERRFALPFIVTSVLLFVGGAAFCYIYVLPKSYSYFLGYANDSMGIIRDVFGKQVDIKLTEAFEIKPMISMDEYFSLTSMLLLVFGAVFELPLLLAVLGMLGIVTAAQLWKFNRFAILVAFIAGAVLTPGDLVVGQIAMGGSLTVLYNLSILVVWLVGRSRARPVAEPTPGMAKSA